MKEADDRAAILKAASGSQEGNRLLIERQLTVFGNSALKLVSSRDTDTLGQCSGV
jgi:hypothetical protein